MSDACALHPLTEATHYCVGCGRTLCHDCGTRLAYCGACAGEILLLGRDPEPAWVDRLAATSLPGGQTDPAAFVTLHAIVPAAVIGMVYTLLYYLLLVRSLFLGGSRALQWIGFCFIAATVLIARYGRTHGDRATQRFYSGILMAAAGMAIFSRAGPEDVPLLSVVLFGLVWLYATRVTDALSLEGGAGEGRRDPVTAIAVLGLVALVAFAVGEPFMLNSPPEVTLRAMVAMIGFLMCTGVTMAAAAATGAVRRAFRAEGEVVLGVIPVRVAAAALLVLALAAMALAAPGVRYSGSGRIALAPEHAFDPRRMSLGITERGGQLGQEVTEGLPWGWLSGLEGAVYSAPGKMALAVVTWLQIGGAVLAGLIVLGLLGFAVYRHDLVRARLGPLLGDRFGWLVRKLRALLPSWMRRRHGSGSLADRDPFADLDALSGRPARRVVEEVYLRALVVLERHGHRRQPATTPHELLGSLPSRLSHLAEALSEITALYTRAAYSPEPMGDAERETAIGRLLDLRSRVAEAEPA